MVDPSRLRGVSARFRPVPSPDRQWPQCVASPPGAVTVYGCRSRPAVVGAGCSPGSSPGDGGVRHVVLGWRVPGRLFRGRCAHHRPGVRPDPRRLGGGHRPRGRNHRPGAARWDRCRRRLVNRCLRHILQDRNGLRFHIEPRTRRWCGHRHLRWIELRAHQIGIPHFRFRLGRGLPCPVLPIRPDHHVLGHPRPPPDRAGQHDARLHRQQRRAAFIARLRPARQASAGSWPCRRRGSRHNRSRSPCGR